MSLNKYKTYSRLWQYLNVYFLKPFDALNDTVSANILSQLEWPDEVVELGVGDGIFSFIMHGGRFPLSFDRYLQVDFHNPDIFDTHTKNLFPVTRVPTNPTVMVAIDARQSHIDKVSEIGFARRAVCSPYEHLPLSDSSYQTIFYYIPHGLKNHSLAIHETYRVLAPGGTLLLLVYNSSFYNSFLCHRVGNALTGRMRQFFLNLDNGRHDELMQLARTQSEWNTYFNEHGFSVEQVHSGLSTAAWKLYDVQTRPMLKPLIKLFNIMPNPIRNTIKFMWMLTWYPILLVCLLILGAEKSSNGRNTCFLAFQLRKL